MGLKYIPIEQASSMGIQYPQELNQLSQPAQAQAGKGGYGTMMDGSGYSDYLMKLINANTSNPTFQKTMLGEYLNQMNPATQQSNLMNQLQMKQLIDSQALDQTKLDEQKRATDIDAALSLMSSDNPTIQAMGQQLLSGYFTGLDTTSTTQPQSYFDYTRSNAKSTLADLASQPGVPQSEYGFYNYLSSAPDKVIQQYQSPVTMGERGSQFNKEMQANPILNMLLLGIPAALSGWNNEPIQRSRIGY